MGGLPSASGSIAIVLLLFPAVLGKLLRINEWYGLNLPTPKSVSLQLDLFYSCDSTSLFVRTERDMSTRLQLFFDGTALDKMDVDSTKVSSLPQTHRIIGGCREKERKSIVLNFTSTPGFFELQTDGQVFKRRKGRRTDHLEIGLPQETPCCIIKAVLLADGEEIRVTTMEATTFPTTSSSESAEETTRLTTVQSSTTAETTKETPPVPIPIMYNWTEIVNREWSVSFMVCAGITCFLMTALVLFGVVSWGWLMTKPSEAHTLYRVDTPISIF